MDHYVPTVGYGISKRVKGLIPSIKALIDKYPLYAAQIMIYIKGRSDALLVPDISPEDTELIQAFVGKPTDSDAIYPQFCYLTDTSIKGITDNLTEVYKYPIIIVECTFYADEDMVHAQEKYHIHWNLLEPIMMAHTESLYVLIHRSKKYRNLQQVMSILESKHEQGWTLPANILIWPE
jgi:hypothetical protein